MIRVSIAAAALALLAATNPGAAQNYGYGYNSYDSYGKPSYGYSRYGYKNYGYNSYKPSYGYNSYDSYKPSYGYSRYGYKGYGSYDYHNPSDFGFNSPYYGGKRY